MSEELRMPETKGELLAQIEREYADFTALLLAHPEERRAEVWDDGRSFKDLTAHVADWEAYALARLQNAHSGNVVPSRVQSDADLDRVNADIQAKYANLSWDEAWRFLDQAHAAMVAHLVSMPDADIFDPQRSEAVTLDPETNVRDLIAWNTSHHYREHADEIRATIGT